MWSGLLQFQLALQEKEKCRTLLQGLVTDILIFSAFILSKKLIITSKQFNDHHFIYLFSMTNINKSWPALYFLFKHAYENIY